MKPRHIAYIIWIVIALLGVVSSVVPDDGWHIGGWNLRFPTLAEALDMDNKDDELSILNDSLIAQVDTMEVIATVDTTPQTTNIQQVKDAKPHPQATKVDTRTYLAGFYAALDSSSNRLVRVVQYGDSQIEEDRITNILREQWQKQYGGGGVGLIPLHQTIPSRTIRQWLSIDGVVQSAQGGPKRHLVYGPRKMRLNNGDYGVMGQMAVMDSTLLAGSEHIVMNIETIDNLFITHPHNDHHGGVPELCENFDITRCYYTLPADWSKVRPQEMDWASKATSDWAMQALLEKINSDGTGVEMISPDEEGKYYPISAESGFTVYNCLAVVKNNYREAEFNDFSMMMKYT